MTPEIRAEHAGIRNDARKIARAWEGLPGSPSLTHEQVKQLWDRPVSSLKAHGSGAAAGHGLPGGHIRHDPAGYIRPCSALTSAMPRDGTSEYDANIDVTDPSGASHQFWPNTSRFATVSGGGPGEKDPLGCRLMLAVSSNGKDWHKTGQVIANHSSVPCLAVETNAEGVETLYLFFITVREMLTLTNGDDLDKPGTRPTPLAVAYTTDLLNWTYRLLGDEGNGFSYTQLNTENTVLNEYSANDPSVVIADSVGGTHGSDNWFMYYTLHFKNDQSGLADPPGPWEPDCSVVACEPSDPAPAVILVASAAHLYDFSWTTRNDGQPLIPTSDSSDSSVKFMRAEDPSVLYMDNLSYRLFAGGSGIARGSVTGYQWTALLDDFGETVEDVGWMRETCPDLDPTTDSTFKILMNNGVVPDESSPSADRTWIAAVDVSETDRYIIATTVDSDGDTDVGGCTPILQEDQTYECNGIREAAVAKFGTCWVMVYVTGIPDYDSDDHCYTLPST